ncbi:MAG: sigma-70 family RNA polymerase sigma factor [Gemmatimonas sp.]|nr:sigma-70 family RNA polymerase sigma factor [Gemmatimonas sp.]
MRCLARLLVVILREVPRRQRKGAWPCRRRPGLTTRETAPMIGTEPLPNATILPNPVFRKGLRYVIPPDTVPKASGLSQDQRVRRGSSQSARGGDDALLARAIAQSDTSALEFLISRYWIALTSYASRMLDDMELAEDVVQRVFVSIWRERTGWSPRSVRAYLYQCTRNLALDEIRSREARRERERESGGSLIGQPPTPETAMERTAIENAVDTAIQGLSDRRREAFVLAYLKNLSYQEIATVMGISTKTVSHHVSGALADLRERLGGVMAERPPSGPSLRPLPIELPDSSQPSA